MVVIEYPTFNGTDTTHLIFPVLFLLQIVTPVIIGILIVLFCLCLVSCVVCFCIGKSSNNSNNGKSQKQKSRLEREATIYTDINPAGMIENQFIGAIPLQQKIGNATFFLNPQLHAQALTGIRIETHRPPMLRNASTESTYQDMTPKTIQSYSSRLESVEEVVLKDDDVISISTRENCFTQV